MRLRIECVLEGVSSTAIGARRGLGGCSGAILGLNGRRGWGRWIWGSLEAISRGAGGPSQGNGGRMARCDGDLGGEDSGAGNSSRTAGLRGRVTSSRCLAQISRRWWSVGSYLILLPRSLI